MNRWRRFRNHGLPTVGAVVLFAALLIAGTAIRHADQSATAKRHDLCVEVQKLKGLVDKTLIRQKKAIPTNEYYKQHPAELAAAMREIDRSIKDFKPTPCP